MTNKSNITIQLVYNELAKISNNITVHTDVIT